MRFESFVPSRMDKLIEVSYTVGARLGPALRATRAVNSERDHSARRSDVKQPRTSTGCIRLVEIVPLMASFIRAMIPLHRAAVVV